MTPRQFEDALAKLSLTQTGAGIFLDVGDRQIRRWVAGQARIPGAVAKLLRLMIARKIKPENVS